MIDLSHSYNLIAVQFTGLKQGMARSACSQWDMAGENSGLLVLAWLYFQDAVGLVHKKLTVDLYHWAL